MIIRADFSRTTGAFGCRRQFAAILFLVAFGTSGCRTPSQTVEPPSIESNTLTVREFSSDARFQDYLGKLSALEAERRAYVRRKWHQRIQAASNSMATSEVGFSDTDIQEIAVLASAALGDYTPNLEISAGFESILISGESETITNNQQIGVDEGDIVKRIGEYVLLLRRGRLFSFAIGTSPGSSLRLVDRIDLPPQLPQENGEIDSWYDEVLVHGSKIVVIGYNYGADAVEIELFQLSLQGRLSRIDTIFISSFDYFDGSNYASRLIGGDLILYAPIPIRSGEFSRTSDGSLAPGGAFPIWPMRILYSPQGEPMSIARLVFDSRIFVGVQSVERWPVLHAMLRCPLGDREFRCTAVGILGPESEMHYMSKSAFYLWLTADGWILDVDNLNPDDYRDLLDQGDLLERYGSEKSVIYRIPLDQIENKSPVSAVEVRGYPSNQFAFREGASTLDVFSIEDLSESSRSRVSGNEIAIGHLIRIPLTEFHPKLVPWNEVASQELPVDGSMCVVNRFVGEHLIYSDCHWWDDESAKSSRLRIARTDIYSPLWEIELGYDVSRIEKVGGLALITGTSSSDSGSAMRSESWLSVLGLEETPNILDEISVADRRSDYGRSHAFNFAPLGNGTIMALPLDLAADALPDEDNESKSLTEIHYFHLADDLRITSMGAIAQSPDSNSIADGCRASCYDWYGSARPFFIGSRIFGLIDYELIEAEAVGGRLREVQRTSAISNRSE